MQHLSTCSCSRRSFLRGCGLTLSGFGIASLFPTPWVQHALAGSPAGDRRLLFIFLRGGNDGLNAVIPHGDPSYSLATRPTIYVAPNVALDLNGFASLHPALSPMIDLYNAGDLAVIHRVGYPNNSKSHFDGSRIWENGTPAQPGLYEGWLYRYIAENSVSMGVDLPALSLQPTPPVILQGAGERFVNIANPNQFSYVLPEPKRAKAREAWSHIAANLVGLEPYRPVLAETQVKLTDVMDEYASWDQANWNPRDPDNGWSLFPVDAATNEPGFAPTAFPFFRSLKICALSLLESDGTNTNGTRIAGTQQSGFDHHTKQGGLTGQQPQLLSWIAHGIRSLHIVLSGASVDSRNYAGIWDKTVVATLSEFGRGSDENGSQGTDHGAASSMFLAGGAINGGVYNCDAANWPAGVMYGVEGRYLAVETDFRAVFWEVLRDHMGAAAGTVDAVFPQYSSLGLGGQELGLIRGV